jgi:hypothetical protein
MEEPGIRSSRLRQLDAEQLAAAVEDDLPSGPGGAEFTVGGKKKKKGGSEGGGDFTIGGGGGSKKGRGQVSRGVLGCEVGSATFVGWMMWDAGIRQE